MMDLLVGVWDFSSDHTIQYEEYLISIDDPIWNIIQFKKVIFKY